MKIEGGSYNIIENCNFYRNRDSGMQIDNGASYNSVLNCDSYYNADTDTLGEPMTSVPPWRTAGRLRMVTWKMVPIPEPTLTETVSRWEAVMTRLSNIISP
jgi:hypothetical protein